LDEWRQQAHYECLSGRKNEESANRMKQQLLIWKQLLIVALLCGAGYAAWHQRAHISELTGISFGREAPEDRRSRRGAGALPVIVEAVSVQRAVDRVQAIGDGRAHKSITIYPEVSGIVSQLDFEAGDKFKTGDVILRLDDAKERIAVAIAEAKRAEAQRKLDRYEELIKRNAIAAATVDTTRTELRTAELELEQAKEALAERTIRAPFDGIVGIPQVEEGDRVSDTTAITTFDDRSVILVEFDVPEIHLERIRIGHPITATTAGLSGRRLDGRITQINSRVDPQTRAVRLRAALENPDDVLRGGMSFTVNLSLERGEYPAVAELALLYDRDGAYVWTVKEGEAQKVAVSVVKRAQGRVLVDGDLAAGALVVVEGTQRLRPGRPVSFERPDAIAEEGAGL
jgi:RND family efflux transporter MFP subunit